MSFWELFFRLLPYRPAKGLAALYWHLTRRRLRASIRLRNASADLPFAYAWWIRNHEQSDQLANALDTWLDLFEWRPRFAILVHEMDESEPQRLERSIAAIEDQVYPDWILLRPSGDYFEFDPEAVNADYVLPVRAGDALSRTALFRLAEALQSDPDATILYGDQDELDHRGKRTRPWFKPKWNEEMFLAQDYISAATAIELRLAHRAAKGAKSVEELLLAATSQTKGPIVHIPYVLCHVTPGKQRERLAAVDRHVTERGGRSSIGPFGTIKVEWPLPAKLPLVSVIVPTRDKFELLRPCVESVLARTEYSNFEILIIDNGSVEKRTCQYLASIAGSPRVRVITDERPYNFSALNNLAVREALGTYVCLLNNDTEIVTREWLTELMRYAVRPDVGAVGAKLLYEDGSIQHAGVVIGIGEAAGHAHRFLPGDQPGYFHQPHIAQYVSAVTGACLVVDKAKFEAVGGLDEAALAVAFNDVDLCLKLEAAGWRNVYVPHAVLLHHESRSRGKDNSRKNVERYRRELTVLQERWGTKEYDDPLHNPNLDRHSESFVIRL